MGRASVRPEGSVLKRHLGVLQQLADAFVIGGLFDKTALLEHVEHVVEFAYVVGDLKHVVSLLGTI